MKVESKEIRKTIITNIHYLLFASIVLNLLILALFPIDNIAVYQHPALYSALVYSAITLFALKTDRVQIVIYLALSTGFVLLTAMFLMHVTTTLAILWTFQFLVIAYLLVGFRQGLMWLGLITALMITLVVLSERTDVYIDRRTLSAAILTASLTTITFAVHDSTIRTYIDTLRRTNDQIREESGRRYAFIDALADGIITTDQKGNITYLNDTATQLLGITTITQIENAVGKSIVDCVQLLDLKENPIPDQQRPEYYVLQTGKHINTESAPMNYKVRRADGTVFPVETAISPIRTGSAQHGIIQIFRDVTWQQQINQAKDEFVSLASHQLGTPLSAIKWACEMLEWPENYKVLQEPQKKILEDLKRSSVVMSELVGDLLNISRLELGTLAFDMQRINLNDIAKQAAENANKLIQEKPHVELHTDVPEAALWTKADPRFVRMIFDNILSNSIKYTTHGTIQFRLFTSEIGTKIGGRVMNYHGTIAVISDTGCGIPKKQQDQIFSKLFRADNVKTTNVGGTGLGLYLVSTTLNKMGGTTWFESEEDTGTQFYVFFPEYKNV